MPDWAEIDESHAEKLSHVLYSYPSITGERFYRSDYASGFPMRGDARYFPLGQLQRWAVIAHKLLFRLVYGLDIDLRALPATDAVEVLADVVAYARLYDLVYADFTDRVAAALTTIKGYWLDVVKHPAFHVGLATHLWEDEAFAEAMNHLVGNMAPSFSGGLEAVGLDEVKLKNHVLQQRSMVMAKLTSIRIELARLIMTKTTIPFTRENYKGKKRIVDLTLMTPFFGIRRRDIKKTDEDRLVFIATSIFNEWLTGRLGGFEEHEWEPKRPMKCEQYEYTA